MKSQEKPSPLVASFDVLGRTIGFGEPCFIVAEAGSNHDRDFNKALRLIDVAAEAGVDAVKFQTYTAEGLYSRFTPRHRRYSQRPWDLIKQIEMPEEWLPKLKRRAEDQGVIFFATPFDISAVDALDALDVGLFKIASMELGDLDLVRHTASKAKPLILSTGGAAIRDIEHAVDACVDVGNNRVAILQCTTAYPAPPHAINLRAIATIRDRFSCPTGFSDHSLGTHIALAGAALGMSILEKHFTLDRSSPGPDHPFALEPSELKGLVEQVRDIEAALGDGQKTGPSDVEKDDYRIAHRSIHARVRIRRGQSITRDMLVNKRPSFGIEPRDVEDLVGLTALVDIPEDHWISWDMVKPR